MKKNLRIIFMGTPEFAVPSLQILVENQFEVVAVVTAADKPRGRGQKVIPSPVKAYALEHNIPVLQPTNLKSPDFHKELKSYHANLQVVVAFRMLPELVWDMPEIGTFNLHASYLPQYRGAAPINWAIMNGETETGVTTFMLTHEIDTGNILFQEKEPIHPDDTAGSLYERLMQKGSKLVLKTVNAIANNDYQLQPQNTKGIKLQSAPKIHRETCKIDWNQSAEQIRNFVRGLSPYPAAWTTLDTRTGEKICKVYSISNTHEKNPNLAAGQYITDNKNFIHIQTQDYLLSFDELQIEGRKRMSVEEFLRGNTL
ncbi:methionyl-tRNA formyltransferase [Catalinimonas sp. 4WD22]|uniref:methionyl-tRNA formyltransferase n=1 Tax=Catalinimonas locisalis TaxID=3133978 RepID=UPI003101B3A2